MEPADISIEAAIALFNRHAFFECHEVLEDLWRPLPPGPQKQFLQGLLQVGVGYYHWQRGNYTGAKNKLQSGIEKLAQVARQAEYSPPVDVSFVLAKAEQAQALLLSSSKLPTLPLALIPRLTLK